MTKRAFSVFFLVVFLCLLSVSVYGQSACPDCPEPGGLVPCGRSCDDPSTSKDECEPCTLCDFFVMIERWIDGLLFKIVPALAALMIAIGGGMYVLSRGDPEKLSQAKKIFASIAIGMVIIYGAWLIINLFFTIIGFSEFGLSLTGPDKWFKIECETTSISLPGTSPDTDTDADADDDDDDFITLPPEYDPDPYGGLSVSSCVDGDDLVVTVTVSNPEDPDFKNMAREYEIVLLLGSKGDLDVGKDFVFVPPDEERTSTFTTSVSGMNQYRVALYEIFRGVRFIDLNTGATAPPASEQNFSLIEMGNCSP